MKRIALCLVLVACGGGSAPKTETPAAATASSDSPGAKCLAIAGAKRERRPDEPAKVGFKHVLVTYVGSKRASASVTRSREDACLRAQEARSKLEAGASFEDVVKEYSEEPGAASRGGSVGVVERKMLVPPVADAAFELHPGETSHVVESDFGFHVIQRTE